MGRPSDFTQEKADAICERLAHGESLRRICRDEDQPSTVTVLRWLRANESFRIQYAQAREDQAEAMFEEMLDIADDGSNDYVENAKGETVLDGEHVQRSRLRVDTRKWILARMAPKKYGDKQEVEHSGKIEGQIVLTMPSNGR